MDKKQLVEQYKKEAEVSLFNNWTEKTEQFVDSMATLLDVPEHIALTKAHPRLVTDRFDMDPADPLFVKLKAHTDSLTELAECENVGGLYERTKFVREVLDRMVLFGGMQHVVGGTYYEKAMEQLRATEGFYRGCDYLFHQTMLNVAELTAAYAFAYDWCYEWLSEEDREFLWRTVEGTLRIGLTLITPPLESYARQFNNWNAVCVGSLIVAAIAFYERMPGLCSDILRLAIPNITISISEFSPDGAYPEGAGYWAFQLQYLCYALSSLQTAFGTDFGLSDLPGFYEAGEFLLQACSSDFIPFNYSDLAEKKPQNIWLFWFAHRYGDSRLVDYADAASPGGIDYTTWEAKHLDLLSLIWRVPVAESYKTYPVRKFYHGKIQLAFFRSSWERGASYLGIKGGRSPLSHGNLDLGSFVYDYAGKRWFCDLGTENYLLEGFWDFHYARWTYYSQCAEGHNTLVIGPKKVPDQVLGEGADIRETDAGCEVDLSSVYADATHVLRSVAFAESGVSITDDIQTEGTQPVLASFHTMAEVELVDEFTAILRREDKAVRFTCSHPIAVESIAAREDIRKIAVRTDCTGKLKLWYKVENL